MLDLAPLVLAFILIAYSIILHEIAHGYAARLFGDDTAEREDRLTLNPIEHIDPVGTILFPLVQLAASGQVWIAWAKPVPVQVHRLDPRPAGDIVVSIAGVFVNFMIALAMAVVLGFETLAPARSMLFQVLMIVLSANVGLLVFNLLPIPPLDGSHVAKYFLPESMREDYERIGFYGTFILLALMVTGILDKVMGPPVVFIANALWNNVTLPLRGML